MEKEIRSLNSKEAQPKAEKRTIEGYAIVFNSESKDLGGFTEIVKPEAINGVIERSDVLALLNHDDSRGILARSTNGAGTLELIPDTYGVKYRFEAPVTSLGEEVVSGVSRGDIRTSSFSFRVKEEGQQWEKRDDGKYLRTITSFDNIFDVSPVYREAYADTSVAVRSLSGLIEAEQKELTERKEKAEVKEELLEIEEIKEPKRPSYKELKDYYKELEQKMDKLN